MGELIEYIQPIGSEGLISHLAPFGDIHGREDVVDTKISLRLKMNAVKIVLQKSLTLLIMYNTRRFDP